MFSFVSRLLARGMPAHAPATPSAKASRVAALLAWPGGGRPAWSARDTGAFVRAGYQANPVVYRCARLLGEAAAAVPLVLQVAGREHDEHPLLALLARPNPREAGPAFLEAVYGHLTLAGNAYIEAVGLDGVVRELYALRPDRMKVVPGANGWPAAYDYTVGADTVRFDQTRMVAGRGADGVPPVLHLKLFHPVDDHYGLSPLEPAAEAVDLHAAAGHWNKALLDNAARPSGALVYSGPPGGGLTDAQFERLREELESQFQGAANAGRPLLLDGGLDWKPLSLSPREMDFLSVKAGAAREIALALGVPPLMLGLPGDATFSNYAEANRAFYRQTVVPLIRRTAAAIAHWLGAAFGEDIRLEPDLDAVEALSTEREALWRRVGSASFLDDNEKRVAVGYGARDAGPPPDGT